MRNLRLSDGLGGADWQAARWAQKADPFAGAPAGTLLTDDLPMDQWQWQRSRQVSGAAPSAGTVRLISLAAGPETEVEGVTVTARRSPRPARSEPPLANGPLRGRPGDAAVVAGIVNALVSGPNRSQPANVSGFKGRVSRGAGRDIRAEGTVAGVPLPVGASGVLEPQTGRAEVTVSGVRGRGVKLPERIRIYTTPSGDLQYDLPGPVKVGPWQVMDKGTYVIGPAKPASGRR